MSDIYTSDGPSPDGSTPNTNASPGGGAARQAETAKQKLTEAGQALKSEAASFAQDAKAQVSERADQATTKVGSTIHTFADAIRKAGDDLGDHDQTFASRIVREAADGLESLSRALAEKRPEEMLDTVRDFGRRQPVAFIAGSVLAGLALGRFIRASERNLDDDGYDQRFAQGRYDPLGDSEVAAGAGMIASPEAAEPYDVDFGDEEPAIAGAEASDVIGQGVVDQQAAASPAALSEGGDLEQRTGSESVEDIGGPNVNRGDSPTAERGI